MKFDLFSIEYFREITSTFWKFVAFCVIIMLVRGDLKRALSKLGSFFKEVFKKYKSYLASLKIPKFERPTKPLK